ncbi:hypothetical protein CFC21_013713 [Triticum aestivum]|uniref:Serpin domain-containing protein n=3 Tax=Triticinae TaxID=1648030 RepID=A0A3B6A247_WHEAT|nr:hypothetical protein CFC21_013713 [Triticum aestivum]
MPRRNHATPCLLQVATMCPWGPRLRGPEGVVPATHQGGRRRGGRQGNQLHRLAAVHPRGARAGGRRHAGRDVWRAPGVPRVGVARRVARRAGHRAGAQAQRPGADVLRLRRVGRPEAGAGAGVRGHCRVKLRRHGATAEPVDFVQGAEQARRRVNAFVEGATSMRIRDILPPGSVGSSTVVVLANALYFKGAWFQPFDQSVTTVRVPFMTTGRFEFKQHIAVYPGFRALKLPYHNDGDHAAAAFYMLLLLPDDGSDLSLAGLYDKAAAAPEFIRSHAPAEQVPVGRFMVPKFKFTFEFEASADMRKLGVTRAFQGGDFSGMVSGGNGLSISGVYHKATIEVDELGTVAAAATAVSIPLSLSAPRPPVDFVADRPFLFAIAEEKTGGVLFLGHVVNPLAG